MNKAMQVAIAQAFGSDVILKRQLKALGKSTVSGKTFQMQAGKCVAAAATRIYKIEIVSYMGQRGVAFGVVDGHKDDGTPTYRARAKEEDATRQWFRYNIFNKKAKARSKARGVWAKIADDMSTLRSISNKLDNALAAKLHAALAVVVKKFEGEVEAK
jgi:hypothetical protein